MSGHSKWANIKRHKGKVDEQRRKIFTKLGREIYVAVGQGGSNPDGNVRLRIIPAELIVFVMDPGMRSVICPDATMDPD